jgi:hypothetical protein
MASETVGYTADGMIFFSAVAKTQEGTPAQLVFTWDPKQARRIAGWIMDAADKVDRPMIVIKN